MEAFNFICSVLGKIMSQLFSLSTPIPGLTWGGMFVGFFAMSLIIGIVVDYILNVPDGTYISSQVGNLSGFKRLKNGEINRNKSKVYVPSNVRKLANKPYTVVKDDKWGGFIK